MKSVILDKTKNIFTQTSYSEQDIIYVLVGICKYLELVPGRQSNFKVIRFYRNWICHAFLTKDAEKILNEIYVLAKASKYIDNNIWSEILSQEIKKAFYKYSLDALKSELEDFGKSVLGVQVFDWASFRKKLYIVLEDVPLLVKEGEDVIVKLEYKKVTHPVGPYDIELLVDVGGSKYHLVANDRTLGYEN
ncbi:MAG: hypothetical protein AAB367_04480 [Patescibacteria group bacterium]